MNGVIVVDKQGGMTSHDVVRHVRKKFPQTRAGHLGTLDPMATGVLPVCLGSATRIAQFLPSTPKEYVGEIFLGFATTTFDREGEPLNEPREFSGGREDVLHGFAKLTGRLPQTPPPFSAKMVGGVRSYKLARRGQAVEIAPVEIEVAIFDLTDFRPPVASFRVVCSPGTYVRSLAHDLGQGLGCGAHLTSLRRTRSGSFGLGEAVALSNVGAEYVIPLERLLEEWPTLEVSELEEKKVMHGNPVRSGSAEGFVRIFNKQCRFIAIAFVESGWARPRVVLTSSASEEEEV